VTFYPPGHFHSPLLDIEGLGPEDRSLPFDGAEEWENIDLLPNEQREFYKDLITRFPLSTPFPNQKTDGHRYYSDNCWFVWGDAFVLSGIIRREKPKRIVEVGSGFSSAVMLDTLAHSSFSVELTFIEPKPRRLHSLFTPQDEFSTTVINRSIQEVPSSVFDQLEANDILFIDSSHVVKIGSDVSFILLRILPKLRPGVIVHFHDIFYPHSYPSEWIRQGRAWNESLFLRAFLLGNSQFKIMGFNQFAKSAFPEIFRDTIPEFLTMTGGSIWIRKVA
jgi:hypothetical protein